jgi:hypothetical protein
VSVNEAVNQRLLSLRRLYADRIEALREHRVSLVREINEIDSDSRELNSRIHALDHVLKNGLPGGFEGLRDVLADLFGDIGAKEGEG